MHRGQALDAALLELGWHDALGHDTQTAVATLFSLQGSEHTSSASLDHVLTLRLGLERALATRCRTARARAGGPTRRATTATVSSSAAWAAPRLQDHEETIVVARDGDATVVVVVPTAALTVRRIHGMDAELELVEVTATLDVIEARQNCRPRRGRPRSLWANWPWGTNWSAPPGRCWSWPGDTHVERAQFGQFIGKFQAVRHRLAEALVAIEAADAMLGAAWEDESPTAAAVAKALAGRAARTAARHCQQVLAGIGFTSEHELHRYIRSVLVLDELFGGSRTLTTALGVELLTTQQLPALVPL